MKNRSKIALFVCGLMFITGVNAQDTNETAVDSVVDAAMDAVGISKDSVKPFKRIKLDGVSAVVGDYVLLDSDIEKTLIDLKSQGADIEGLTKCSLLGKLMEDRLYAHQAVQDSLLVADDMVNAQSEAQIQSFTAQMGGSIDKVVQFYKKDSPEALREELFKINKLRMLSDKMRQKIIAEMEITPEEVRQFFNDIPEDERPVFGTQLEIAQIVKEPKASDEEKQKVIDKLNGIRSDVLENGASFKTKAILYTEDEGSRSNGGFYTVTKESGLVKEFKDVAFSLLEGEISEPFETIYGYHIILLGKVRGLERDVRHIIISPKVSTDAEIEARTELEEIRKKILAGDLTFAEAARNSSDEKETKFEGGQMRNPVDFGTKFELTKMESELYNQIRNIKDGEISMPIKERDPRGGGVKYKIMKITNRYDDHVANFSQDYVKIQELALNQKRVDAIKKWMQEHIEETYISVNGDSRKCTFANNWLKE